MRSLRLKARRFGLLVVEALVVFGAITAAVCLRLGLEEGRLELFSRYGLLKAGVATLFCLIAFYLFDLYDFVVMHDRRELVLRLIQALGLAWIALAITFYAFPQLMLGRGISLIALPLALTLMVSSRLLIHAAYLGRPRIGERVLIVGSGKQAVEIAREVLGRPDAGYRIAGFVGTDTELLGKSLINPRVIALTSELDEVVQREGIDRIVVAMGERRGQLPTDELLRLRLAGTVSIEEGASFFERITGRVSLNMIRPSWLIFSGRQALLSAPLRNTVHRLIALVGAILSLPIVIVTALLIKLDSRGPIFYQQERVGKNGQTFMLIKFRSMRVDAEKDGPVWASCATPQIHPVFIFLRRALLYNLSVFILSAACVLVFSYSLPGVVYFILIGIAVVAMLGLLAPILIDAFAQSDNRATRLGRIIRKLRIDEIPQFWNILKGDMNFVGPRPERPHFVAQLAREIPYYEQRHLIPPGLTGWAQIKYPYGASLNDARQKLQYDLYYIKNQSLFLDAIILFETTKIILFGRGAQ